MIKSIVFEPDINSYFIERDGKMEWVGSDMGAIKVFELNGISLPISRRIILYARMNQGVWIDVERFLKAGFAKLAISESDIEGLLRRATPVREEKTKDLIKSILTEIDSVIGGINSTWRENRRAIETDLDRMPDEEVPKMVDRVNAWKELFLAINGSMGRMRG